MWTSRTDWLARCLTIKLLDPQIIGAQKTVDSSFYNETYLKVISKSFNQLMCCMTVNFCIFSTNHSFYVRHRFCSDAEQPIGTFRDQLIGVFGCNFSWFQSKAMHLNSSVDHFSVMDAHTACATRQSQAISWDNLERPLIYFCIIWSIWKVC